MSAFVDATCRKCRKRFGWFGAMGDMPPCPKCGYRADQAALDAEEQELQAMERAILDRKDESAVPGIPDIDTWRVG